MAIVLISKIKKPTKGILQFPDPRLIELSKKVETINSSTHKIAKELVKVIESADWPFKPWLGMAAPQIGNNIRMIAIKEGFQKYTLMINPEVLQQKWYLPNYYFKVRYQDLSGKSHYRILKWGKALVFQQEIDHLNGVLACD